MLIIALLQCVFLSSFYINADPLEQKTIQENDSPAQKPFYYYCYNDKSELYLNFYDGYKYKLSISKWLTDDIIYEIPISFGHFTINKDKSYTLKDVPTGIELRAYKSGDSLKLAERIMMKGDMETESDDDIDQRYYLESLAKIQKFELGNSCPAVNTGVYFHNADAFLKLNLKPDTEYEFYVLDVPISSGRWRQRNAEIILSDSSLNKELRLIVDKDHLICSLMPGYLIGTELYLKEPDKSLDPSTSDQTHNPLTINNRNTNIAWLSIGLVMLIALGSWIVIYRKRKIRQKHKQKRVSA